MQNGLYFREVKSIGADTQTFDKKRNFLILSVILIISLLLLSSVYFASVSTQNHNENAAIPAGVHSTSLQEMVPLSYSYVGNASAKIAGYSGEMHVLVSFKLQHTAALNQFLNSLSDPLSPQYHNYINRTAFAQKYSQNSTFYNDAAGYFTGYGLRVHTYGDRISIQVNGPSSIIGPVFNTTLNLYSYNHRIVYAPSSVPELPSWLAESVNSVVGLSNIPVGVLQGGMAMAKSSTSTVKTAGGYPSPVIWAGNQYIWGSDMQVAYQENPLFNFTYPTKQVIATILWPGYNSSYGGDVAPFYPKDIYAYYNSSLPSGEPHAHVFGVPLNGAPKPGSSAQYDAIGASFENTLDLEMAGSSAPGSSIYNVYGMDNSFASLEASFAYILNPNSSFSSLNNVSVITNSWGSGDTNISAEYSYLQEAQARGITVLASSGDSADNPSSSKYLGGPDNLWFPASMAYSSFGVTAVGGTSVILNSNLRLLSQIVWNISSSDTSDGGPAGSTGGVSSVFSEPSWQSSSEANTVIQQAGGGRGVPDIAGISNDTLVFLTYNGYSYYDNPYFYYAWGTSIASPLFAGMVAEINAVLNYFSNPGVGYLNPVIYKLGDMQYAAETNTSTTGYYNTGNYHSTLPALPFTDVTVGQNDLYKALPAWDLVTGWGSPNLYNLTLYLLNDNHTGNGYAANGVRNILNISALNVTSYIGASVYNLFNASIQQNLFIANSLGAPLYWIQNVIYLVGSNQAGWTVNYTGWSVYPFYGIYPSQSVYEYDAPSGKVITFPHDFNITTWLGKSSSNINQVINYQVNSQVLQIPVPGASYIIATPSYSYYYGGSSYFNGPFPDNPVPGGLAPQFGIVGGPSYGVGHFYAPTNATMVPYIESMGSSHFLRASSEAFGLNITQTGETSSNLSWTQTNGTWNVSIKSGSNEQGVFSFAKEYSVTFTESGLTSGSKWYVNITGGGTYSSTGSTLVVYESNGTYDYTIATADKKYMPATNTGQFTLAGTNIALDVSFSPVEFTAIFYDSGLPSGTTWYINVTGMSPASTAGPSLSFKLQNGSYTYTVASGDRRYEPLTYSGSFSINGNSFTRFALFKSVTYQVSFNQNGLPAADSWYVNLTNETGAVTHISGTGNLSKALMNGTYQYTVVTSFKTYEPDKRSGSFVISGGILSLSFIFSKVTFKIVFAETGQGPAPLWSVKLTGPSLSANYSTSTAFQSLNLINGTYSYSLYSGLPNFNPTINTGTFAVSGSAKNIPVTFEELFNVSFDETGLATGMGWTISVHNNTSSGHSNAISTTYRIYLPNGTYDYRITSLNKTYRPLQPGGTFTVSASQVVVNITFSKVLYTVTFSETGLASGTLWSMKISGGKSMSTTSVTDKVNLQNGTYSYTDNNTTLYYAQKHTGTFNVAGSNITVGINYIHYSYIQGTVNPSNATVTVNGVVISLNSGQFNITETEGSYNVVVSEPGFKTNYTNFTLNPGNTMNLNITLSAIHSKQPIGKISLWNYYAAIIVIILIVGAAILYMRRRR